jgi:YYY domain-containing protein
MVDVLKPLLIWLAVLDLLGWLHFPLCFRVGRLLRDRGLALAKLAGLFIPTYISWLICHAAVPHTRTTIGAVVAALAAINALLAVRDRHAYVSFFRQRWPIVLVLEAAFWIGGIGAGWVRSLVPAIAYDPGWWGAEKWSDFTLVSALSRQWHFPPLDPWLAGFPTNYYYYGHLAWATMAKLTATPPNIAYNVALAMIVALALTLSVSLGYHLFRSVGLGILLAWLVVCGGNVKPLAQLIQNWHDVGRFVPRIDFWNASRAMSWGAEGLIQGSEINEFPSFSFILGDLHPHFSAHPLFLGFLLIVAALWRAGQREILLAREVVTNRLSQWLAVALLAGLLYTTNTWDCYVGLFLAATTLPFARGFRRWPVRGRIVFGVFIFVLPYLVATRLLFLPFELFFVPPRPFQFTVQQWLPPMVDFRSPLAWVPPTLRSTTVQWLFYFGLFVLPYLAWQAWGAVGRARSVPLDKKTAHLSVALAIALLVYVHGQRGLVGLLAFALVALAPHVFRNRRHERLELVSILAWGGLLVSFLCEWLYYDDAFSGDDERINTVFKVYYSLWPVAALAVVGACSALWGGRMRGQRPEARGESRRWVLRRMAAVTLIVFLTAISALYPLFGWTTRVLDYRESDIGAAPPTLDGLKYLDKIPGISNDYRVGLWLRHNASPYAVVAEADDWGYSEAGRFAAIGGVTCLLGWSQHESVWREGSGWQWVFWRKQALDDLFTTTSLETAIRILTDNKVDYVAVGSLERRRYPAEGLVKFDFIGKILFRSGDTVLYGVSPAIREKTAASGGSR